MLQLTNPTPFPAKLMLLPDRDGVSTVYAVVKGTFSIGDVTGGGHQRLTVADEQAAIALADEYRGEPPVSSIRVPSDVCLGKPGTDVLLDGSAWAPGGRPTWRMDVTLAAGPVAKTVRVSADRLWESGPAGATMRWLEPFVRMPLVWERAFGGFDETDHGPVADRRNPAGTGFRAPGGAKPLGGLALPNVEDPGALIAAPSDRPAPAGFAPVAPHWEPRVRYGGTYDQRWQRTRAPYLPTDFDPRFFQLAPAGLVAPRYLQPGEWVQVRGATPSRPLQFQLPPLRVEVTYVVEATAYPMSANLDTVIVQPDENRVLLTWRAALRCDKKATRVSELRVTALAAA
jgi:hypothetical protein